jgi:hypothetical protein
MILSSNSLGLYFLRSVFYKEEKCSIVGPIGNPPQTGQNNQTVPRNSDLPLMLVFLVLSSLQ